MTSEQKVHDAVVAIADLTARSGARQLEIGYLRDHDDPEYDEKGDGWFASARFKGARLIVDEQDRPEDAADGLAGRLLDGGHCVHCGRITQAAPTENGEWQTPRTGECIWRREGTIWLAGCGAKPSTGANRAQRRAQAKRRSR